MKIKAYQVTFPATLVLVMVTFLVTIILFNANLSFAASARKESQAIARTSAVEHTEAQIKLLEGELNITAAQKELWNNFIQVMRENAKDTDARHEARHKARAEKGENDKPMNAVEHMKFHSQITESHLDQMKKLIPPFEALYASMSDEQKKTTDTLFETGKHGKSQGK